MALRMAPQDIPNAKIAHQVDEIEEGELEADDRE